MNVRNRKQLQLQYGHDFKSSSSTVKKIFVDIQISYFNLLTDAISAIDYKVINCMALI